MQRRLPDLRARVDALPDSDRKTRVQGADQSAHAEPRSPRTRERVTGAIHDLQNRDLWTSDSASTGFGGWRAARGLAKRALLLVCSLDATLGLGLRSDSVVVGEARRSP